MYYFKVRGLRQNLNEFFSLHISFFELTKMTDQEQLTTLPATHQIYNFNDMDDDLRIKKVYFAIYTLVPLGDVVYDPRILMLNRRGSTEMSVFKHSSKDGLDKQGIKEHFMESIINDTSGTFMLNSDDFHSSSIVVGETDDENTADVGIVFCYVNYDFSRNKDLKLIRNFKENYKQSCKDKHCTHR